MPDRPEYIDERGHPSAARLWLGRWMWWTMGACTYVLVRAGFMDVKAFVAVVEVVLGTLAMAVILALVGWAGGPRVFQYVGPALSAAAGRLRRRHWEHDGNNDVDVDVDVDTTAPPAEREDE